jgi:hypothetical protein
MNEMILANHLRRMSAINSAMFDIAYEDMCNNDDIHMIHVRVVANTTDADGKFILSNWIPPNLVSHVQMTPDLMTVKLSLTPSAIKYLNHSGGLISFECRIDSKVTTITFPVDQIVELIGYSTSGIVDQCPFNYLVYDANSPTEEKPKRPTLTVVK